MTDARTALAEVLSAELGTDIDEEFMRFVDRVLVRLFLYDFIIVENPEGEKDD